MKKFVVTGASTYGVKNAGDDAMLSNLVVGLRKEFPGCDIAFVCRHPDSRFDAAFEVRSLKNIDHDTKAQSVGRWFYGFNPGDPGAHLAALREAIAACDAVIIGGNSFMEISPNDFLRGVASYSATFATWAKLFGKPYFLYGLNVTPAITGELTKQIARFLCNNAVSVSVREEFTRRCLLDAGVKGDNVRVLADPAFGVATASGKEGGLAILRREGITLGGRRTVGVNFRSLYWSWDEAMVTKYAAHVAGVCDRIATKLDADLLFIPNCTYDVNTELQDDRYVARRIRAKMRHADRAHLIEGDYLVQDTLCLFPLLDLHLSNRRHSCVFAAIHGVPFVALTSGTPTHIKPFMEELGLDEQVFDLMSEDMAALEKLLMQTWERRVALAQTLRERVPRLRQLAHEYVPLIAAGLRGSAQRS